MAELTLRDIGRGDLVQYADDPSSDVGRVTSIGVAQVFVCWGESGGKSTSHHPRDLVIHKRASDEPSTNAHPPLDPAAAWAAVEALRGLGWYAAADQVAAHVGVVILDPRQPARIEVEPGFVDVVMSRGPAPDSDFVELENPDWTSTGEGGTWIRLDTDPPGYWRLRVSTPHYSVVPSVPAASAPVTLPIGTPMRAPE